MQEFMELGRRLLTDESGQTTAEYALVILGAAAVAGALIAWAGGGDVIKNFFNKIFSQLMKGLG
jgi:Flp pilus assembly pilin Flp